MTNRDDSKPRIVAAVDLTHVHPAQRVRLIGVRRWQERQRRLGELLGVTAVCLLPQACGDGPVTSAANAGGSVTGGPVDGLGGGEISMGGSATGDLGGASAGGSPAVGGSDATVVGGSYSTGGAAADVPPWVSSTAPVAGTVIGHRPASIRLVFSEPMDRPSVEAAITITPAASFEVHWDATGTAVDLTGPGGGALELAAATQYVVTVGPGAQDSGGLGLDGNHDGVPGDGYSTTLETQGPPRITSTSPREAATGVAISISPNFRFDLEMVPSTVTFTVSFTPASGISTSAPTASWSDNNRLLTLRGLWLAGKRYTITIAGSSTSLDGQALDGNGDRVGGDPFTLHFSTVSTSCTCQVDNPSCPLDLGCPSDLGCPLDSGCPADGCLCEVQCACQLDL